MTKSLRVLSPSLAKPFMPFTRPSSQDQDLDQDQCYKTKTEFDWSETGLATRPKSQTTSLDPTGGCSTVERRLAAVKTCGCRFCRQRVCFNFTNERITTFDFGF